MFYGGMAYRKMRESFKHKHGFAPSTATLHGWVRDLSRRATRLAHAFKVDAGSVWVADEMAARIDGKNVWLWNVTARDSRFLLATHLSFARTVKDAETLFRKASRRAKLPPLRIITGGLAAYREGIEKVFGAESSHVVSQGIRSSELNNDIAERLRGTIRDRTKTMRGMETRSTAGMIMDGFMVYYNHLRPQHTLKGKTPAQAARCPVPLKNWNDIAALSDEKVERLLRELQGSQLGERPLRPRRPTESTFRARPGS
jgi:transposase-like protein